MVEYPAQFEGTMFSHILAAASLVPSLANFPCGAPIPAAAGPKLYFPVEVGARWVYQGPDGQRTEVVTAVEKKRDGSVVVSVSRLWPDGRITDLHQAIVSDRGLFRVYYGWATFDPPLCRLKLPYKAGESWKFDRGRRADPVVYTTGKIESIAVPAGEFEAIRVDWDVGGIRHGTRWYARGIGLVKEEYDDDDDGTTVLTSFLPGKK